MVYNTYSYKIYGKITNVYCTVYTYHNIYTQNLNTRNKLFEEEKKLKIIIFNIYLNLPFKLFIKNHDENFASK